MPPAAKSQRISRSRIRQTAHERTHALRVRLRVRERERRAPAAAEDDAPRREREVLAQRLEVGDERGGVLVEVAARRRSTAAALVEEEHAVVARVEEARVAREAAGARATVQEKRRHAVGAPKFLVMDRRAAADELAGGARSAGGVESAELHAYAKFRSLSERGLARRSRRGSLHNASFIASFGVVLLLRR